MYKRFKLVNLSRPTFYGHCEGKQHRKLLLNRYTNETKELMRTTEEFHKEPKNREYNKKIFVKPILDFFFFNGKHWYLCLPVGFS